MHLCYFVFFGGKILVQIVQIHICDSSQFFWLWWKHTVMYITIKLYSRNLMFLIYHVFICVCLLTRFPLRERVHTLWNLGLM